MGQKIRRVYRPQRQFNLKREKRTEARKRLGLRVDWLGHCIPPSLGKRYNELNERHLRDFERFADFIEGDERFRIYLARETFNHDNGCPLAKLRHAYDLYGTRGLTRHAGFPHRYIVELDDDDACEVYFRMLF